MIPLSERLSQLWSGELPDEEARALEHRIASEPDLAAQWQRLCAAMDALDELPDVRPPPPLRSAAAVTVTATSRGWVALPLLIAASATLWLLPSDAPELVLLSGAQWVEGDVHLLAADTEVDVDGKVWISVEPATGAARVGEPNAEDGMNRSTVIAGVAGALVTVVVYEGTAVVHAGPDAAPATVLSAGESHRSERAAPPPAVTPEARAENVARLQAELATAQQALAEAEFEGALTRGQLTALQGTASPWPADVPAELGPRAFRDHLEARLAEIPDVEIAEVDCAEYPCVAAVRYTGTATGDEWNTPVSGAMREWLTGAIGEDLSISLNSSRFRSDDREARYLIFGAHDAGEDSDVGTRTDYRIDAMVDDLGHQLEEPSAP